VRCWSMSCRCCLQLALVSLCRRYGEAVHTIILSRGHPIIFNRDQHLTYW